MDDIEESLKRVDMISSLISRVKDSSGDVPPDLSSEIDTFFESEKVKEKSRTVINTSTDTPTQYTGEQAGFMKAMEADANERAARRKLREKEANDIKNRGNEYFAKGDYENAVRMYIDAIAVDPGNASLHTNKAQAYLKLNHYHRAKEASERAVYLDDRNAKGHLRRAIACVGLKQYDEAISSFETARKLAPATERSSIDTHINDAKRLKAKQENDTRILEAIKCKGNHNITLIQQSILEIKQLMDHEKGEKTAQHEINGKLITMVDMITDADTQTAFRVLDGFDVVIRAINDSSLTQSAISVIRASTHSNEEACLHTLTQTPLLQSINVMLTHNASSMLIQLLIDLVSVSPAVRKSFIESGWATVELLRLIALSTSNLHDLRVMAIKFLSVLATDDSFRERIHGDFMTQYGLIIRHAFTSAEETSEVLAFLTNLSGSSKTRDMIGRDLFDDVISPALDTVIANPQQDVMKTYQMLGLIFNLSLSDGVNAKLMPRARNILDLLNNSTSSDLMSERVLGVICRLCTDAAPQMLNIITSSSSTTTTPPLSTQSFPHFTSIVNLFKTSKRPETQEQIVKCVIKCAQHQPRTSDLLNDDAIVGVVVSLLHDGSDSLAGNAALLIAELAKNTKIAERLTNTNVVELLINHAKKDKCQLQANSSIALARLAQSHQKHLARLRELNGIEILAARAK